MYQGFFISEQPEDTQAAQRRKRHKKRKQVFRSLAC